jgi:mannose-6-phosphate isomerase-like protein (cupin superfamily)
MAARVVRHDDLRPCTAAFIDARTPGSHLKENFTIIGPGVAENPRQHVHIREPHGFNIGGARQPPRIVNSQHSHDTAEVFMVLKGTWSFILGPRKEDGAVTLHPGDTISIPIHVFRGFENVGSDTGFLFAILGGDDPGRVTWSPDVLEAARGHGLILLEDGRLVDTAEGEQVPAGARVARPLGAAELARFRRFGTAEMGVVRRADLAVNAAADLPGAAGRGALVIADDPAAPIAWPHGFTLRALMLRAGEASRPAAFDRQAVLMVHDGRWSVAWDDGEGGSGTVALAAGDTMTVPPRVAFRLGRDGAGEGLCWMAMRGDRPARAAEAGADVAAVAP